MVWLKDWLPTKTSSRWFPWHPQCSPSRLSLADKRASSVTSASILPILGPRTHLELVSLKNQSSVLDRYEDQHLSFCSDSISPPPGSAGTCLQLRASSGWELASRLRCTARQAPVARQPAKQYCQLVDFHMVNFLQYCQPRQSVLTFNPTLCWMNCQLVDFQNGKLFTILSTTAISVDFQSHLVLNELEGARELILAPASRPAPEIW